MPVTAKFSEEFYERLGHNVADELVDWFNTVDATYRLDLRDLFQGQFTALRHEIAQRFGGLDAKFDAKFAAFDEKLEGLEAKLERRISEVRSDLRAEIAGLRVDMHRMETRLIRWMVAMWAGTIGTMIALMRFSG